MRIVFLRPSVKTILMRGMGEMNRIRFSERWDKLNDSVFTTIRPYTPEKATYYKRHIGQEYKIAKTKARYPFALEYYVKKAYLVSVEVVNPRVLDLAILAKDVRLNGQLQETWFLKLLSMKKAILLTFSDMLDEARKHWR